MNLTFLSIFKCNINSIEPLTYLFAPKLKTLCMEDNHISSIKPIEKCSFNQINKIDLSKNQISLISLYHFNRCLFSAILLIYFFTSDQLTVVPNTHQIIQMLKINSEKLSYRANYSFPKKPSILIDKFCDRFGQFSIMWTIQLFLLIYLFAWMNLFINIILPLDELIDSILILIMPFSKY